MKSLLVAFCFLVLQLGLAFSLPETQAAQPDQIAKSESLTQEVKKLQQELAVKQEELGKLRHKWAVNKGRTPTKQEIADFEEKRAKGAVKVEDNPYINKSPISSPGRWRAAYYAKLAEIDQVKERLVLLEQELAALKP